jgi:hypothetical protein
MLPLINIPEQKQRKRNRTRTPRYIFPHPITQRPPTINQSQAQAISKIAHKGRA